MQRQRLSPEASLSRPLPPASASSRLRLGLAGPHPLWPGGDRVRSCPSPCPHGRWLGHGRAVNHRRRPDLGCDRGCPPQKKTTEFQGIWAGAGPCRSVRPSVGRDRGELEGGCRGGRLGVQRGGAYDGNNPSHRLPIEDFADVTFPCSCFLRGGVRVSPRCSFFYFFVTFISLFGCIRASLVALMLKNLPAMQETRGRFLDREDSPGEGNGSPLQFSCLENPLWTEEPGGLQPMGSQRAGQN